MRPGITKCLVSLIVLLSFALQPQLTFSTQTGALTLDTQSSDTKNYVLEKVSFNIAVVPQLPAATTHSNWGPLLQLLSQQTGIKFQLLVYKSFVDFETDIINGKPDLVYMNPFHQLVAYQSQGYTPLVRDDSEQLIGILVVRKDSQITSVAELSGKTLAFPSPNAFGASLYMRALLSVKEGIEFQSEYTKTHTNVYRNVALGLVDAGGGVKKTLDAEIPEIRNQLRIIYETPGVASHPLSAHPRVPVSLRETIIKGLIELSGRNDGKTALILVHLNHPIRADFKKDYQNLNKLHLNKYSQKYTPQDSEN